MRFLLIKSLYNVYFEISDDFKATAIAYFKPITKNGNTYLEFKKLTWKFTTSKMHLRLNNLFNGDKALGKVYHLS